MELSAVRPEGVVFEKLDSGLTVVIQQLSYSPVAAVSIAYRAGSVWETDSTRGYSHLCEHMMFRGSEKYGPGEYWRVVQRNGGLANAYTSRDITLYYSILPVAGLRDVLDLESDRMFRCTMKDDHVASETAIILEEELLTQRDDPQGSLDSLMYSAAFRRHPYGRPITGTEEDIGRFSAEGLRKFYRNFYQPGNAVLSIVGDAVPDEVLTIVRDLFDGSGRGTVARPQVPVEPGQDGQRRAELEHPSQLPGISIGFRVPEGNHPDSGPLSLISLYLSSGRSSRFEKLLIKPSLALDVSASTNTNIMPGLFVIRAVLPEGGSPEMVESEIYRELERISEEGIEDTQVELLRRKRLSWSIISDADPPGRSRRFSTGYAKYGDPFFYWKSLESLRSVTSEELARTAGRYLVPGNSTVAVLWPVKAQAGRASRPVADTAEPRPDMQPPATQTPGEIEIPDRLLEPPSKSVGDGISRKKLENGLRIVLKRDASFPIVSVGLSFPMGASMEPPELTGLAQMTAETMLYGTPDQDSIEFNARLEDLGASIDLSSTAEFSGGVITSLSRDCSSVLSVVSDLLRNPAFREEDLGTVRSDALSSLEEWLNTPLGAAMDSFARTSTEPPELSSVPTRETLMAIARDDLVAFHGACCRPDGTILVIVGDFEEEHLTHEVELLFGDRKEPEDPPPEALSASNAAESVEELIPLQGREQIAIVLGSPAPPRLHEDSHAISILNRILGEGIGSRLGRNVREAGLSYHVSSMYIPLVDRGRLASLVLTSPSAFERAIEGLRREFSLLSSEEVTESELRLEKASYIGQQELAMMKYSSIARILLTFSSLGLPLDHDRQSMRKVCALTGRDLLRAAGKWLGSGVEYVSIAGGIRP